MMWRAAFAIPLFLVSAAQAGPALDAQTRVIFPAAEGPTLLKQCSRSTPQVGGFWQPDAATVNELEGRLPGALLAIWPKHKKSDLNARANPPVRFGRQYVGLIVNGRKAIYVNTFPLDSVDWNKPVQVCDGGDSFFGAEYDPSAKTFSDFQFNGAL